MANPDAQAVKQRIERLDAMHELAPRDFAYEDGLANQLAKGFGKEELKATQLRKIFHALKDVERRVKHKTAQDAFDAQDVSLMMPNLAYAYGRGLIPEEFYQILRLCLRDKVKTNEDFLRSVQFIEAVLAYHKFNNPSGSRG